jgi:hypothetical protein
MDPLSNPTVGRFKEAKRNLRESGSASSAIDVSQSGALSQPPEITQSLSVRL